MEVFKVIVERLNIIFINHTWYMSNITSNIITDCIWSICSTNFNTGMSGLGIKEEDGNKTDRSVKKLVL